MSIKRQEKLDQVLNQLLKSYREHSEIELIGSVELPAKDSIIRLVDDILVVLYPGLIRQESFDHLNLPYLAGQKLVSILERLELYTEQVLCWKYSQEGDNCHDNQQFGKQIEQITFSFLEYLPSLRETLALDVEAILRGDPAAVSKREIVLAYPGLIAVSVYRIANFLHKKNVPLIPRIMTEYIHSRTGIDIHPGAEIGRGLMIDHGTGVVIGETAVIGNDTRIYQGVTLGALSPLKSMADPELKRHPTIEENVIIYSGATILGKVSIGAGSIIGGNVWLVHDVPPGSRVYLEDAPEKQEIRSGGGARN